jgi:hypothetical protein
MNIFFLFSLDPLQGGPGPPGPVPLQPGQRGGRAGQPGHLVPRLRQDQAGRPSGDDRGRGYSSPLPHRASGEDIGS